LAAIILAAGYSSRMGEFKPLMSIGECTAVEAVIRMFLAAKIRDVYVVIGHRADDLRPVVEAAGARCVVNPEFDQGMFSSIRAGAAALPQDIEACFITPTDIPLVRVSTVRRLAQCFEANNAASKSLSGATENATKDVIYPVFQSRRGHPTLVSRTILAEISNTAPEGRLSTLLAAHEQQSCNLFVPDEGIRLDMDTLEDLAGIRAFAMHRKLSGPGVPTPTECEAILSVHQPDERVVRHSRMVGLVAHRLAVALAERGAFPHGFHIDPMLAQAAGLLHDLAKGKPNHADAGAQLLRELDLSTVADVVALHTDYPFTAPKLDEAAIVYLADKLVSGDRFVGLEQRFHRSFERFQGNPDALASASRRRATAEAIAHQIESCLQRNLQQMIGDLPENRDLENKSIVTQDVATQDIATEVPRGSDATRLSRQ
jgi:CTP:molybdopterin cytidylyltransferase MocA/HD superfamily phosphohydrolase YqeK